MNITLFTCNFNNDLNMSNFTSWDNLIKLFEKLGNNVTIKIYTEDDCEYKYFLDATLNFKFNNNEALNTAFATFILSQNIDYMYLSNKVYINSDLEQFDLTDYILSNSLDVMFIHDADKYADKFAYIFCNYIMDINLRNMNNEQLFDYTNLIEHIPDNFNKIFKIN